MWIFWKSLLNLLQCCFYCLCCGFFGQKSYGILAPQPGIKLPCPALEDKILIIGLPGRCHSGFKPLGMRHSAIVSSIVDRNMNLYLQKPKWMFMRVTCTTLLSVIGNPNFSYILMTFTNFCGEKRILASSNTIRTWLFLFISLCQQ